MRAEVNKLLLVFSIFYGVLIVQSQRDPDIPDRGENTAIDFSDGVEESDGVICVLREEEQEKVEQELESQCTQQNVTQCYNTYTTRYKDTIREKCEEVFIKTCRIVMKERPYNHTTRVCKRPLVKKCDIYQPISSYGGYGVGGNQIEFKEQALKNNQPKTVCQTIYETQCNTTHQSGVEKPVTKCDQVKREICAEDNCQIVEGTLECIDATIENTIEIPQETCNMEPQEECRNVTTSIPQLIPEEICRQVPKELCQAVFLNPSLKKTKATVKYCMNPITGDINARQRQEVPPDIQGRNPRFEKLRQPRTGFNEVKEQVAESVNLQSNRGRLLNGK